MFRPGRVKRIHQQRIDSVFQSKRPKLETTKEDDDGTKAVKRMAPQEKMINDLMAKQKRRKAVARRKQANASLVQRRAAAAARPPPLPRTVRCPTFAWDDRKKQQLFRECLRFHRSMCATRKRPAKPLQIVVQGDIATGKTYFVQQLLKALKETPMAFLGPVVAHDELVGIVDDNESEIHASNLLIIDDVHLLSSSSGKHAKIIRKLQQAVFPKQPRAKKKKKGTKKAAAARPATAPRRGNSFIFFVENLGTLPASLKWLKRVPRKVYFNKPNNREMMAFAQSFVREHFIQCDFMTMMQKVCECQGDMRQLQHHLRYPDLLSAKEEASDLFGDTKKLMKGKLKAESKYQFSHTGVLNLAQSLLVDVGGGREGVCNRRLGDREMTVAAERFSDAAYYGDDGLVYFGDLPSYHNLARFNRQAASAWGTHEPMPGMWDERKEINTFESRLRANRERHLPALQFVNAAEMVTGLSAVETEGDRRYYASSALRLVSRDPSTFAHIANRLFAVYDVMTAKQIDVALMHAEMTRGELIEVVKFFKYFRTVPRSRSAPLENTGCAVAVVVE